MHPLVHTRITASHTGVPPEQTAPQAPHDVAAESDDSHPAIALQSAKPALHGAEHAPAAHVAVWLAADGHTIPHSPQFIGFVAVFTSQPFTMLRSQLPKFGMHVIVHAPAAQPTAITFAPPTAQAFPHIPQ